MGNFRVVEPHLACDLDELLPGRGVDRNAVLFAVGAAHALGLTGRQHFYLDHDMYIAYGEHLPTYKPSPTPEAYGDLKETLKDGKPAPSMADRVTIKSGESKVVVERGRITRVSGPVVEG